MRVFRLELPSHEVAVMVFYRLEIAPDPSEGEGTNCDEWFTSLVKAKARRQELITADPLLENHNYGRDYQIDRVVISDLPKKELVLCVLNRKNYVDKSECVVEHYWPPGSKEVP